ncbi:MAG: hypothetical protein F9K18_08265, partial [Thermoanaerobaculia bacterium]
MILATLLVAVTAVPGPGTVAVDPRQELVELAAAGQLRPALERVTKALEEEPARAGELGFALLRGDLLERLGREREAVGAYAAALGDRNGLESWSRLRLALLDGNGVSIRRSDDAASGFSPYATPDHFIEQVEIANA